MHSRVQKWGNSLAVRIPKPFASAAGLEQNMPVEVSVEEGRLIITPIPQRSCTLEQLLSEIREDNLHREVRTGPAQGREVW